MSTKNPETPRSPETTTPEQELVALETQISWDRKKFETLLKDSTLKTWLEKIIKKESEPTISTFREWYKVNESNRHLSIESWTRHAVKQCPALVTFICWDLGLPYEELAARGMKNTKFSQLTFEQKMNFMSFNDTIRYYNWDISRVSPKDFIKQCKSIMAERMKSITDRFNKKVNDNKNLIWLVDIEKILKNIYWLTDDESKKLKEYITLIQKHPEYVWWWETKQKLQLAWWSWWWSSFRGFLKRAVIIWGGIWWLSEIKSCSSLTPPETRVYGDHTEIEHFEEVFKCISLQADTKSNRREISEDWLWHFDESTWSRISRWAKWVWNRIIEGINVAQHRNLDLELKTQIWYIFDAKSVKCNVELKKWKAILHVKVKKPEIKIISEDAKIYKSRREWINVDKFDDYDLKAVKILRKEALDEAKKPENIQKAKESLRKNIKERYQVNWIANSQMIIKAEDIQDVVIEEIG